VPGGIARKALAQTHRALDGVRPTVPERGIARKTLAETHHAGEADTGVTGATAGNV